MVKDPKFFAQPVGSRFETDIAAAAGRGAVPCKACRKAAADFRAADMAAAAAAGEVAVQPNAGGDAVVAAAARSGDAVQALVPTLVDQPVGGKLQLFDTGEGGTAGPATSPSPKSPQSRLRVVPKDEDGNPLPSPRTVRLKLSSQRFDFAAEDRALSFKLKKTAKVNQALSFKTTEGLVKPTRRDKYGLVLRDYPGTVPRWGDDGGLEDGPWGGTALV